MGKNTGWPGARRRSFLLVHLLFPTLWGIALGFASPLLTKQFGLELMNVILPVAAFVPVVVIIVFILKRLQNLGMSRSWFFAVFAPFLNIWLGFRCFACPAGYAYHKKMDGIGIVLGILYALGVLILLAAIGMIAALFMGAIDDPEFQKQIREIIQSATSTKARFSPPNCG